MSPLRVTETEKYGPLAHMYVSINVFNAVRERAVSHRAYHGTHREQCPLVRRGFGPTALRVLLKRLQGLGAVVPISAYLPLHSVVLVYLHQGSEKSKLCALLGQPSAVMLGIVCFL